MKPQLKITHFFILSTESLHMQELENRGHGATKKCGRQWRHSMPDGRIAARRAPSPDYQMSTSRDHPFRSHPWHFRAKQMYALLELGSPTSPSKFNCLPPPVWQTKILLGRPGVRPVKDCVPQPPTKYELRGCCRSKATNHKSHSAHFGKSQCLLERPNPYLLIHHLVGSPIRNIHNHMHLKSGTIPPKSERLAAIW